MVDRSTFEINECDRRVQADGRAPWCYRGGMICPCSDGRAIISVKPLQRAPLGMARTFQNIALCEGMIVPATVPSPHSLLEKI
jgi:hypothetical protein